MGHYFLNASPGNVKLFSKRTKGNTSFSISLSNVLNFFGGEFGRAVLSAWVTSNRVLTSLAKHIENVISLCAKKEMIGIDAGTPIANVANDHVGWNDSSKKHPCGATSCMQSSVHTEMGVPFTVDSVCPNPTAISLFFDSLKEKFQIVMRGFHGKPPCIPSSIHCL